jgi:hypothetical protein
MEKNESDNGGTALMAEEDTLLKLLELQNAVGQELRELQEQLQRMQHEHALALIDPGKIDERLSRLSQAMANEALRHLLATQAAVSTVSTLIVARLEELQKSRS